MQEQREADAASRPYLREQVIRGSPGGDSLREGSADEYCNEGRSRSVRNKVMKCVQAWSYLEGGLERLLLSPVLGLLEHQSDRARHPQVVVHRFIGEN